METNKFKSEKDQENTTQNANSDPGGKQSGGSIGEANQQNEYQNEETENDSIRKQFEIGLKAHLESTYLILDEQDEIKKLNEIEKTVNDFVDSYLLETHLIAGDVALSVQHVVDEFIKSKVK